MSRSDSGLQPAGWSVQDDALSIALALEALRMMLLHIARSRPRRAAHALALANELAAAAHDVRALASAPTSSNELTASVHSGAALAHRALEELEPYATSNGWRSLLHLLALFPVTLMSRVTKQPRVDRVAAAREALAKLDRILARTANVPPEETRRPDAAFSNVAPTEARDLMAAEAATELVERTRRVQAGIQPHL